MLQEIPLLNQTAAAAKTTHFAMGTVMAHKAFGPYAPDSLRAVCREIARIEGLLSRFLPGSDISRINESAGVTSAKISPETYAVLAKAVEFSRSCAGCFDVTIEPLVNLWQKSKAVLAQPDDADIQQTLSLVNYQDLLLAPGDRYPFEMTAGLRYAGQAVDLGGVGKGYAGDRIVEVFQQYEVTSAYSNLGGNVVTVGAKPDGSPWQIGIQHPRDENKIIGAVAVVNQSVVTSGDYQRYYIDSQGKRCHHILDPRTGHPAESGLISVSIVSEKSLAADALSTIVFVAGMKKGLEYLSRFPQTEAILVDTNLHVYVTHGLKYRFTADQGMEVTILD